MAGGALSIVRSATQQLGSLLVEEAKFLYDVNEKVNNLLLHLQCIQCALEDVERNHYESQLIRQWIFQIRELAYEAGDIIDKYGIRVSNNQQHEKGFWNTIKWFCCVLCDVKALHEVGSDIDALSRRISNLTSIMQLYGLKVDATQDSYMVSTHLAELRRTNSQIEEDEFVVGFDKDVENLVHHLVHEDKTVAIISGMGGLGKTTLAKMVYKNEIIKNHFDGLVWVFISQQFVAREVFELIWKKVGNNNDDGQDVKKLDDVELQRKIKLLLQQKKYLVVLDDIWNEESWNHLKAIFPSPQESCTKLLLTSRDKELLLKHVDQHKYYRHQPTHLTVGESWELLHKIASRGRYTIDDEMIELGKKMVEQCECLPLAVTTLGGILGYKPSREEWIVVKDNIHSYLASEEGSMVMQVLELSYKDLPFYLRPCFLYTANFPEDSEIRAQSLYHMWIAEGFVLAPSDGDVVAMGRTCIYMEDIAERYLNELVKRYLIQVGRRGKSTRKIKTCKVHDIMRDMCIRKAKEENFTSIVTEEEILKLKSQGATTLSTHKLHRLAVSNLSCTGFDNNSAMLAKMLKCEHHLRSLVSFYPGEFPRLGSFLGNSSLLRVLSLENSTIDSLTKDIGNLIHLRYLSLFGTIMRDNELPSSIGNLSHLDTLNLRVYNYIVIPNMFGKLKRLRHLYLPRHHKCKIGVNLELCGLTRLETLKNLRLQCCRVKDLLKLEALRKLRWTNMITLRHRKKLEVVLAALHAQSSRLSEKSFTVNIRGEIFTEEYAGKLTQLPGYELLRGLAIFGKMPLPNGLNSIEILLQHMTNLEFEDDGLDYDPMPILEKLSNLTKLTLSYSTPDVNKISCSSGGFPQLIFLMLSRLYYLKEWEVERGSMPKLGYLVIEDCFRLKELPDALIETTAEIKCDINIPGLDRHAEYMSSHNKGRPAEFTNSRRHAQYIPYLNKDDF